jgi:hypothetical protein
VEEELIGIPLLHLGLISLPYPTMYALSIRRVTDGSDGVIERRVFFNWSRSQGCAFSVESPRNYTIWFESVSRDSSGRIEHNGTLSFAADLQSDNFYSPVGYLLFDDPTPFPTASAGKASTTEPSTDQPTPLATPQIVARPSNKKTSILGYIAAIILLFIAVVLLFVNRMILLVRGGRWPDSSSSSREIHTD